MNESDSYNPDACCSADCFKHGHDEGICWGDVEVIDEVQVGEDEWDMDWVHACQGHKNMWWENLPEERIYIKEEK